MLSEGQPIFMVCSKCHATWSSREALFEDPLVRVRYFHAVGGSHSSGIVIFTHQACGASFGVDFAIFDDLAHFARLTISDCSIGPATGFCIAGQSRTRPPALCSCRAIWNVLSMIQLWPKRLANK
jgi:hypothetical protein